MRQSPVTSRSMPPTAGGGIARLAMARATAAGVDPEPLLHGAGLTLAQVEDRDTRIGVRHQILLLNQVADAVGDDRLGFHLAERFDRREIGLLYYVLASSATLGEAMARIERYSTVTNEGIAVQCRHDASFVSTSAMSACRGMPTAIRWSSGRRRSCGCAVT
jgi:hypothetical protein